MPEDSKTSKRLLLIGCKNFAGIDAVAWEDHVVPNIPDYDIVIVSVPHLTDNILLDIDSRFFNDIKDSLMRLLHSKGKLVILLSPTISVKREEKYPEHISNLDWCPLDISTSEETGQSVIQRSDKYRDYLKKMSEHSTA